jgi:hypothetical protein
MGKLGKREMIILGVMALVALYGVVDFLLPKPKDTEAEMRRQNEELQSLIMTVTAGMGKDPSKTLRPLIFSRTEREWTRDPFLDDKGYKAWTEVKTPVKAAQAAPVKIEFVYAGYLEVDRKRIAVINGAEYAEGETLDPKEFVLKSVTPTKVVIENRGTRALLNIPLQE